MSSKQTATHPSRLDADTVASWICDAVARLFEVPRDRVTTSTSLHDDLGADSVDRLQLLTEIEDRFGIEFTDAMATRLNTVGDAVRCVSGRKANRRNET